MFMSLLLNSEDITNQSRRILSLLQLPLPNTNLSICPSPSTRIYDDRTNTLHARLSNESFAVDAGKQLMLSIALST